MLKKLLLLITICLMILNPMVTLAEGNETDTIIINEEKTPEAAKKKSYSLYYAGAGILLLISASIIVKRKKHNNGIKLILDSVEDNNDGSYTVYLGYDNSNKNIIKFNEGEAGLRVLSGNAILLKRDNYQEFDVVEKKNVIVAVINENSKIEYYAGDEHIIIEGSKLVNKKGEE